MKRPPDLPQFVVLRRDVSVSKWQNKQLVLWPQSKSVKTTAFSESLGPALWEMLLSSAYEPEKKETSYFLDFCIIGSRAKSKHNSPLYSTRFQLNQVHWFVSAVNLT